ncbi:MAG: 3-dehydroquinate synthase family protein, partial [Myxococcota bacterium]|nr:3-dehydroquinate synthase family protein [Myxococcota bacterium]
RGCQFVQVPTTTLAVMDSSVGGKTAVNTPRGKNLVGTFYQPQGVFVALSHLATQTSVEHAAGLIEGVKMALTLDADVYHFMTKSSKALIEFSESELTRAIAESVRLKAQIVKADEFESGVRAVLNFGHTVGHAIEAGESFKLLHGQAVALGMIAEAQWAEMEGYSRDISSSLRDVVEDLGLRSDWRRSKISTEAITLDKKRKGGGIQLPIVSTIGSFDLRTITVSALVEFVKRRSGA